MGFPPGEHTFIPATISTAVGLAMDDFLPRGAKPPKEGACVQEGLALDVGATYAVDVDGWRILAVQR
ncbi:hypothetical protein KGD87_30575 [Myxococcus sp. SDU36]|nr:hypothetical protein KGD87_30575 [Myxococcus sp. SDU36]